MSDKKPKKRKQPTAAKKSEKQTKAKTKPAAKRPTKKSAVKPVAMKTDGKKATPKKAAKEVKPAPKKQTVKKPAAKKTSDRKTSPPRLKAIKHNERYELGADEGKILVIGAKGKKSARRGKRQLKRVASLGGFTAWDGRTGKTFATEREANAYALDVLLRTGEIIPVTHTQRTVSHTFRAENQTEK